MNGPEESKPPDTPDASGKKQPNGPRLPKPLCEFLYPEYFSQNPDDSIQVSQARLLLFETVRKSCPTMLQYLSHEVFPAFSGLVDGGCVFRGMHGPSGVSPYEHLETPEDNDTPRNTEQRKKLKEAFDAWACKFQITEKWAKDGAIRTMNHWRLLPRSRQTLKWNPFYVHTSIASAIGDPFEFRFGGWDTQRFSWAYYSRAIREKFKAELDEYEQQTRQRAESIGLVRSHRTFSPANFEWFALSQFYGLSSAKIADRWSKANPESVDASTILKGIKTAALLLGWNSLRSNCNRKTR